MDTLLIAAEAFDPEAIGPVHVAAAIVLNATWIALTVRDRRLRRLAVRDGWGPASGQDSGEKPE